jgi:hypothetical protein
LDGGIGPPKAVEFNAGVRVCGGVVFVGIATHRKSFFVILEEAVDGGLRCLARRLIRTVKRPSKPSITGLRRSGRDCLARRWSFTKRKTFEEALLAVLAKTHAISKDSENCNFEPSPQSSPGDLRRRVARQSGYRTRSLRGPTFRQPFVARTGLSPAVRCTQYSRSMS